MHRSGTSALSRALNLLGGDMPPRLIEADQWNAAGYWESKPIKDLNEEMLVSGGGEWSEWLEFNPDWFKSSAMQRFRDRAIELVGSEFTDSPLFIFKDPRLSILMPFWRSIFDELGIDQVAIHPLRNPVEVARSLERRNNFLMSKGVLLWLRYTLDGERGTRGLRRIFTTFDDLLEDPAGLIERTQDDLGLIWPRNSVKARREIAQFLSADMRHHRDGARVLRSLSYGSDWVVRTYETLMGFAADGENADGRAALDEVRAQFVAASHAFGTIAKDNEDRHAKIAQLQQDREKAGARQAELESSAAAAQAELDALRAGKVELERNLSSTQERLAALQTGQETAERQLAEARKERDGLRERARSLEQHVAGSRKQAEELKLAQAEVEARAVKAQEQAEAIQRAKEALEARHLATQKERDTLREMRAKLEGDLSNAFAAVKDAQQQADAARQKQEESAAAIEEAQRRADEAEREAATRQEESAQALSDALRKLGDAEQASSDHQVKAAQTEALAKQWEERAAQLSGQLAQERSTHQEELKRLQDDLAQTDSALRQRQLETEQAAEALLNARNEWHEQQGADAKARAELEQSLSQAQSRLRDLERAKAAAEEALKARFSEIATLTEQFALREMELAQARQSLLAANQSLADRDAQLRAADEHHQADRERHSAALERANRSITTLEQNLRERTAETIQLQGAVNHRELELAQTRQMLDDVRQRQDDAEASLAERNGAIERLRADLDEQTRMRDKEQERLRQVQAQVDDLQQALADQERASTQRLDAVLQNQRDIEADLAQRDVALREHRQRLEDARVQEGARTEELDRLRTEMAQHAAESDRLRKAHTDAVKAVEADLQDMTRKREILRATALASQQSNIDLYNRLLSSLETMLAQAVLPFPKLTRKKTEQQQRRLIIDHAGFDADWYVSAYPDVAVSPLDPALHFIRHGLAEGRSPNAKMAALRELAQSAAKR
ncbi:MULTISPECIES: hypothetical protein [Sphingobium]|uniref:hypothetical protein n=1 Tax=Sphingobium TaxID=165695 RepID=UPI001D18F3CD|nr:MULTISPECIES: hypothetical protein [Sphingobium]MCC4258273.1 hypothetical protein [Sphingobium lactosutens]MEE2741619.1 hypothetical protein [Pseudomonadota bacterium]